MPIAYFPPPVSSGPNILTFLPGPPIIDQIPIANYHISFRKIRQQLKLPNFMIYTGFLFLEYIFLTANPIQTNHRKTIWEKTMCGKVFMGNPTGGPHLQSLPESENNPHHHMLHEHCCNTCWLLYICLIIRDGSRRFRWRADPIYKAVRWTDLPTVNVFFQHLFWKKGIYNMRQLDNIEKVWHFQIITTWISLPRSG